MQPTIAFVNGKQDCGILQKLYPTVRMARVTPDMHSVASELAKGGRLLWVDPMLDGYDLVLRGKRTSKAWQKYREALEKACGVNGARTLAGSGGGGVAGLLKAALDKCVEKRQPKWITVPQLPVFADASRNRVNRTLAAAAGNWRSTSGYTGKLVLPLVFTHQSQLRNKTAWKPKIKTAVKCHMDAGASVVWAVDSSLNDQSGAFRVPTRLDKLIAFHMDLREAFPESHIVTGPYWGMNLILWVRQLSDHPAISLGRGYQYSISGTFLRPAKARVAIPPLLRWATVSPALRAWIDKAIGELTSADPAYQEFKALKSKFALLSSNPAAARQVAGFYSEWLKRIGSSPAPGRPLALYQEFSSAFVLGKQLPTMPRTEKSARRPEKVAEQLMLRCL